MKNLKLLTVIIALLITAHASFGQGRIVGKVIGVIDGKTVTIQMQNGGKLTAVLQYIEVPEPDQPLHQVAADHLSALVLDKKIEFRARTITPLRTAGYLFADGIDVGQQMIRDGAAWYAVLEKSGQEAAESVIYQTNETQAKAEKRGVWSIENLKPSWEIRAEAEENRRQERLAQEEAAKKAAEVEAAQPTPKPVIKRQFNSESQLLAASDTGMKLPANMQTVGGLLVGYEPSIKLGVVATPLMKSEYADKDGQQILAVQIAYLYYDGNENKGRQSVYLVCVDSQSKDYKFLKYNDLIVTADNQKIVIGKAKRFFRQTDSGVIESLIYEVKKPIFTKIANARNLEIKVGSYSRNLKGETQAMLHNLLQTSL